MVSLFCCVSLSDVSSQRSYKVEAGVSAVVVVIVAIAIAVAVAVGVAVFVVVLVVPLPGVTFSAMILSDMTSPSFFCDLPGRVAATAAATVEVVVVVVVFEESKLNDGIIDACPLALVDALVDVVVGSCEGVVVVVCEECFGKKDKILIF